MTNSGSNPSITLNIISLVSIPVTPMTPGDNAATGRYPPATVSYSNSNKWFVTNTLPTVIGPNASGVTFQFPNPTIKPLLFGATLFSLNSNSNFSDNTLVTFDCCSVS